MKKSTIWIQAVGLMIVAPVIGLGVIAGIIISRERQIPGDITTGVATPNWLASSIAIQTNPPTPPETRPTGIFDAGVDFWHEGFAMTNAWQQKVNGSWALVEVGIRRNDPQQGILVSSWEFPNAAIGRFYRVPGNTGNLRIVSEKNYRLTIQAESGAILYFDVLSQSFVESLNAIVATITPPPTHTPTPTIGATCHSGYPPYPEICETPTLGAYPR